MTQRPSHMVPCMQDLLTPPPCCRRGGDLAGAQKEVGDTSHSFLLALPGPGWTTLLVSHSIGPMQMVADPDSWGWVGTEGAEEPCACVCSVGHG